VARIPDAAELAPEPASRTRPIMRDIDERKRKTKKLKEPEGPRDPPRQQFVELRAGMSIFGPWLCDSNKELSKNRPIQGLENKRKCSIETFPDHLRSIRASGNRMISELGRKTTRNQGHMPCLL